MKKKLFTLLTLLLCVCSGAWAAGTLVTIGYNGTAPSISTGSKSGSYDCDYFSVYVAGASSNISSGNGLRFNSTDGNSYIQVTAKTGYKVTKVLIPAQSGYKNGTFKISGNDTDYFDNEYTTEIAAGSSVKFVYNNTNGTSRLASLQITYESTSGGGGSKTVTSKVLTGINISSTAWDIAGLSDNAATITTAYDHVPTVQVVYTINYDDSSSDTGQTEDIVPAKSGDNYVATSTELTTNVTLTFTNITNQYLFNMTSVTGPTEKVAATTVASVTANFNGVAGTSASVYNSSGSGQTMVNYSQINLSASSNQWFKATFATALEAGDLITSSNTTQTFYLSATTTKGSRLITFPYVVTSEDDLVGNTEVYVWKNSGTGGGSTFTSFTIKRNPKHSVTYSAGTGSGTVPTQIVWPEEGKFTVASGDGLTPPANKVFDCWNDGSNDFEAGATYTMSTSNVTLTAKYKDANVLFAAGEGTGTMNAQSHDNGDVFTLPNSTFTAPEDKIFTGWLCNIDGLTYAAGASYTMTAVVTTFTAQYESILGTQLIKAVLQSSSSATITGTVRGSYTADSQVQTRDNDKGGCKLGKDGAWVCITLTSGWTFKAGDIVNVNIGTAGSGGTFAFYKESTGTNAILTTTEGPTAGLHTFVLPATANNEASLYLIRKTGSNFNPYVDYIEVIRPNSTVTLNASGFATYSAGNDFTYLGADAYTMALDLSGEGSLSGTKITAGTKIPAGAGILFKGTAGAKVSIMNTTGAEDLADTNNLHGTTLSGGATATPDHTNHKYYVLSGNTFKPYTGATFAANKAYFQTSKTDVIESRVFSMTFDGETTGINAVENTKPEVKDNVYYNLNGQRVANPGKGLYIVNGKKVIIK